MRKINKEIGKGWKRFQSRERNDETKWRKKKREGKKWMGVRVDEMRKIMHGGRLR